MSSFGNRDRRPIPFVRLLTLNSAEPSRNRDSGHRGWGLRIAGSGAGLRKTKSGEQLEDRRSHPCEPQGRPSLQRFSRRARSPLRPHPLRRRPDVLGHRRRTREVAGRRAAPRRARQPVARIREGRLRPDARVGRVDAEERRRRRIPGVGRAHWRRADVRRERQLEGFGVVADPTILPGSFHTGPGGVNGSDDAILRKICPSPTTARSFGT